jgi:hypothetical protein
VVAVEQQMWASGPARGSLDRPPGLIPLWIQVPETPVIVAAGAVPVEADPVRTRTLDAALIGVAHAVDRRGWPANPTRPRTAPAGPSASPHLDGKESSPGQLSGSLVAEERDCCCPFKSAPTPAVWVGDEQFRSGSALEQRPGVAEHREAPCRLRVLSGSASQLCSLAV